MNEFIVLTPKEAPTIPPQAVVMGRNKLFIMLAALSAPAVSPRPKATMKDRNTIAIR